MKPLLRALSSCATVALAFSLNGADPAQSTSPVTITAGPDWVPLRTELDIEPGSALDFSGMGLTDTPAGKHGYVIARPDGQFAFEKSPKRAQRFYGVNLCVGAQYLSRDVGRGGQRMGRAGEVAVRVHHADGPGRGMLRGLIIGLESGRHLTWIGRSG